MKSFFLLLWYCSILFIFFSCGDDPFATVVEVKLPEHESRLSVVASFTDESERLRVFVSNSLGSLDNSSYDSISDASVELYENDNLLSTLLYNRVGSGYYETDNIDLLQNNGARYTLKVQAPGYPAIEATQILPKKVMIQNASYNYQSGFDENGERLDEVFVEFNDPAEEDDYYELVVYGRVISTYYDSEDYAKTFTYQNNDSTQILLRYSLIPGNSITESSQFGTVIFSDKSFNGKAVAINALFYNPLVNQENPSLLPIAIQLVHISRDRYLYLRSLQLYNEADGNPFAEPVIVHQNVKNGHGIFTLGAVDTFVIEE